MMSMSLNQPAIIKANGQLCFTMGWSDAVDRPARTVANAELRPVFSEPNSIASGEFDLSDFPVATDSGKSQIWTK